MLLGVERNTRKRHFVAMTNEHYLFVGNQKTAVEILGLVAAFLSGGTTENSSVFQRRVGCRRMSSPVGTAEIHSHR